MIRFSQEKVPFLHQLLIQETGGSPDLRDVNLLDSALESVFQTFPHKDEGIQNEMFLDAFCLFNSWINERTDSTQVRLSFQASLESSVHRFIRNVMTSRRSSVKPSRSSNVIAPSISSARIF